MPRSIDALSVNLRKAVTPGFRAILEIMVLPALQKSLTLLVLRAALSERQKTFSGR